MDKKDVNNYISKKQFLISNISDKIWEFAETAFEEYKSADYLCNALGKEGFSVTKNVGGIETAFLGTFGTGRPLIGLLGEYDALSGLSQVANVAHKKVLFENENGHGCGHNLLGAGAFAACLGIKKYLEETKRPGTVIYFGCPGEEGGSGKAFMAREGVFDGLDACLTWHPGSHNAVRTSSSLANYQVYYKFHGISAHAAGKPHQGRSALDAVTLMNTGVQFLREHVKSDVRIHYAVTNTGGFSPNVVQSYAEVLYLIRAPEISQVKQVYERVNDIAKGAALMTGTRVEIDFVKACSNLIPNCILERQLYENMKITPLPGYTDEEILFAQEIIDSIELRESSMESLAAQIPDKEDRDYVLSKIGQPINDFLMPYHSYESISPGSTDVGDVSWICPTAQITAASWAADTPGHSWQVVAQGKNSMAYKSVIYVGQVLAGTAIDLLTDSDIIVQAKSELETRLGDNEYICPIPSGVEPRIISQK